VYPGGLTYSGHPLACAAAVAAIEVMENEHIIENAKRIGDDVLRPGLEELAAKHKVIGQVRGLGVFFALELVSDQETKEPLAPYGGSSPAISEVLVACRNEGLLIFNNFHRLHVVPPCNITEIDAREGLARLDRALSVADQYYVGE
jgi:taurine--2-oxoglutarate transaminase